MERSNEERLDLIAELMEPASEIFGDKEIQNLARSGAAPLRYVKPAIKNHKQAIITILACLEETDPKDYRVPAPGMFFLKALGMFSRPEVQALFTLQSQMNGGVSSGSAMENTTDGAI